MVDNYREYRGANTLWDGSAKGGGIDWRTGLWEKGAQWEEGYHSHKH